MHTIIKEIKQAVLLAAVLLILCGLAYPFLVTGIGHLAFPDKAGGSLIDVGGAVVGSGLVGQQFTTPHYMKGRPSHVSYNTYALEAKKNGTYTGVASGSANLAPSNPALKERVEHDLARFLAEHPGVEPKDIPADLLTASGSGLDPHISPAAAAIQIPALTKASGLSEETLQDIVKQHTSGKMWGIFGEKKVNVLLVNLDIAKVLGILPINK